MASFADYRERRSPSRRTVRVPLDGDLRAQAVQLREQLAAARQTAWATLAQPGDSDQDTLEAQLADLEQQLQEDAAEFTFVAVSYAELEAIKLACPPSADQPDAPWDPATFGPALVAATCVDPPLSDSEAEELFQQWDPWQVDLLFGAAWDVCNSRAVVRPLSKGASAATPDTVPS